jgi:hypothetical protein
MIQAQVHEGRIEVQEPIPTSWEGQTIKIMPLTPDDPLPDEAASGSAVGSLGPEWSEVPRWASAGATPGSCAGRRS